MKKPTTKTTVKDLKKGETLEHYNAVLLEDIRSKMEQVIEGMDSTKVELKDEIKRVETNLTMKIELTQHAVSEHTRMIKHLESEMGGVKSEMRGMKSEMGCMKSEMGGVKSEMGCMKSEMGGVKSEMRGMKSEMGCMKSEMQNAEKRLSDKIDKIGERLDDHETRIGIVETARI